MYLEYYLVYIQKKEILHDNKAINIANKSYDSDDPHNVFGFPIYTLVVITSQKLKKGVFFWSF